MAQPCSLPEDALFLGLDSSTQSLKATVLDAGFQVVCTQAVHFDSELPHYNTKDGVHRGFEGEVTAPVLMWVEALEVLFDKLKNGNFPFERVNAISGSGQQHGSVYWKSTCAGKALKTLDASKSLHSQLRDAFATINSPIWMDSSTSKQCKAIETAVGGPDVLASITGSRAYERFTGPQIRKLYECHEDVYNNTERISLVSSFMSSLMVGDYVGIDYSDGAGMNLMDLRQRVWSKQVLDVTAPMLEEKLGKLSPSHEVAGKLSGYFVERYSFSPGCIVIHWSGDNPNSLAGLALDRPGDLAISLGTSDTVFGITSDPHPGLEGHVFPNPVDPGTYMLMLCYKNGSLTREEVRNRVAEGSWETFNKKLVETTPLNDGNVGFYYIEPEIIPPLPVGLHRFKLKQASPGSTGLSTFAPERVDCFDSNTEVRAIAEGQFLSMRAHCERIGMPSPPERVIVTGGGSANKQFLRMIAEIFGCNVYTTERPDSASLGAALRAAHGWFCNSKSQFVPISDLYKGREDGSALQCRLAAEGGWKELHEQYGTLAMNRMKLEKKLIEELVM
ncbi:hypothetical protein GOP47_0018818 [Adiantum capillus-veneris]|uniref:Xylulose kinase n=1 Tax=Adiantum capillus-veneris TaxID=13818 RepID=A0A9D4UF67_ADICA|nr:hypothetical protein GOP47_0018818 [Adiantum capillus-veneris]